MTGNDYSTQEILRARFLLRDDVGVVPRRSRGETVVQIHSDGRFFQIGPAEYAFVSLLDGKTSVAEALSLTACHLGAEGFTEQEAVSICRWLIDSGLATNIDQPRARAKKSEKKWYQRFNPFWFKLPLMNPDSLLNRLRIPAGWIHSPLALGLSSVLFAITLVTLGANGNRLSQSSFEVFAPANWVWLGATWILLKVIHEVSHGLACKRYGGDVRELGLVFILFAPLAYVDLTSAWKFKSKWQRIHTALAGIYAELLVAAIAALVWAHTTSPEVAVRCLNVMWLACITTILFNANALMRFDGYYALSDLLEIPNLYADSQAKLMSLLRRVFYGGANIPVVTGGRDILLLTYATLALLWKVVVCSGLAIAASALFHGAGILLAAAGVAMWICLPVVKLVRNLSTTFRFEPARGYRCLAVASVFTVMMGSLLFFAPWPGGRTVPGTVEFAPPTYVRARVAGLVNAIHVGNGQPVSRGDLLLELTNPELATECAELQLSIEKSIAQRRLWIQKQEYGEAATEFSNRLALQNQLAQKQARQQQLQVRASAAGTVVARNLMQLLGTFVEEGTELMIIGVETSKELRISISEDDIDAFRAAPNQVVAVHLPNRLQAQGRVDRVNPRASVDPRFESLCAVNGGWIAVQPTDREESESGLEFLRPRFDGRVRLEPETARTLHTGQSALVTLGDDRRLVAGLFHAGSKWINDKAVQIGLR